jgi:hypothetical protein
MATATESTMHTKAEAVRRSPFSLHSPENVLF